MFKCNSTDRFLKKHSSLSPEELCIEAEKQAKAYIDSENLGKAEDLLIYATQHFFSNVEPKYKALIYYRLGELFELKEDFITSYTYYDKYRMNNTENEGVNGLMLRITLLRDNFKYSEDVEKYLSASYGEYDLGLRRERLYELIAKRILAEKNENSEEVEKLTKSIKALVLNESIVVTDIFFKKDNIPDRLHLPAVTVAYLDSI